MKVIIQEIIGHKNGISIAATLGLAATLGVIYKRDHDIRLANQVQRFEIFKKSSPLTDEEAESFSKFFENNANLSLRFAQRYFNNAVSFKESQDVVADVFVALLNHWPRYKFKKDWELRRIMTTAIANNTKNLWRDEARDKTARFSNPTITQIVDTIVDKNPSVEDQVVLHVDGSRQTLLDQSALNAINKYFDNQPFHLKLYTILNLAGLDNRSIGRIFNKSTGAAKQSWTRLVEKYRKQLSTASSMVIR